MTIDFIPTDTRMTDKAARISPRDVRFEEGLSIDRLRGSFGKAEVDRTAAQLVRFFQERGSWKEFDVAEYREFLIRHGWKDIFGCGIFFGLAENWSDMSGDYCGDFVRLRADGKVGVTDKFIVKCAGCLDEVEARSL